MLLNNNKGDGTKTRIINIQTDKLFNVKDRTGEDYYFHGSIINVNKNNLTREFQGKGYVRYKQNGVDGCIMLSNETNIRSIVYVSQLAVEANSEHSAWLQQNYIDTVASVSPNYTEENYLEQADGSYTLAPSKDYQILKGLGYTANIKELAFEENHMSAGRLRILESELSVSFILKITVLL